MKRCAPVCSRMLAVAASLAWVACRAPSGGAEHEPAPAERDAEVAPPVAAQPHGHADDAAPVERVPAEASDAAAPVEPPPVGEPSETETEIAPEPAPEPERPSKTCRRPAPHYTGPLRDLVGLDEAAVRRCLGDPERTSGSTWHYRWPPGCAYEVSRVVVRFARGKVASAHAKHEITGQHCGADF